MVGAGLDSRVACNGYSEARIWFESRSRTTVFSHFIGSYPGGGWVYFALQKLLLRNDSNRIIQRTIEPWHPTLVCAWLCILSVGDALAWLFGGLKYLHLLDDLVAGQPMVFCHACGSRSCDRRADIVWISIPCSASIGGAELAVLDCLERFPATTS